MPQAIAAEIIAYFAITATAVIVAVEVLTYIAFTYALNKLESALVGKPSANQQPVPQTFMARGAVYPRSIVYGPTRVSGVVVFEGTTGTKNQNLWFVIAIAGHQLDSMTDVWFDNVKILSTDINGSTGLVTGGQYANFASIWKHTGTDGQSVDSPLSTVFGPWNSAHRGRGVAYLVIRLNQSSTVFPTGAPQNFFVTVQGRRLYDPRLDSTNGGSGSQRYTDATTWTYSSNPALAAADYLTGGSVTYDIATPVTYIGMREAPTRIDWALVANAANICDQTPVIPSTTQTRYLLAGVLSCNDVHSTNLGKITAAMAGQVIYRGGQYRIFAGAYDSPTLSFSDSDLIGNGYEILAPGRTSLYNSVSPIYVDPARNYQQVNSAINSHGTFTTADGEQIVKSIDLTMVDNEFRAQRIGELICQQSRNLIAVTLNFGINGFKLSSWDTFNLTLADAGWVNKVFRVVDWQLNPDQPGVTITAREENSSAYTDPIAGFYAAYAATPGANATDVPLPPGSFQAAAVADAVVFTWAHSTYFPPGATYKLWRYTAATPFSSATMIWQGTSTHYTLVITDSTNPTMYYWVTASYAGFDSDPIPAASSGLAVGSTSVTAGFRATANNIGKITRSSSVTTGSSVCSATGGVPAYTYAWTRVSGDTSIACTSPTAATTTFSRSGMVLGDPPYVANWKCTVTDSTAATTIANISIQITCDDTLGGG